MREALEHASGGRWVVVYERDGMRATAPDLDRALWRAALLAEDPQHIVLATATFAGAAALRVLGAWPTVRRVLPPAGGSMPALLAGLSCILARDPDAMVVALPTDLDEARRVDDCASCGPLLRAAAELETAPDRLARLVVLAAERRSTPDEVTPTGAFVCAGRMLAERIRERAPDWWYAIASAHEPTPHLPAMAIDDVIAAMPRDAVDVVVVETPHTFVPAPASPRWGF